ncbi:hypothetical protein RN001_000141 [Aquatica leii]|uniref:C-type lectin domain-containing protein n=1 Tax=Aquatica leii TaxID=1421715 RepID=A0AAN7P9F3_9COLE|nr:hypothetical protein RN001_000141 [Aquatica leii]
MVIVQNITHAKYFTLDKSAGQHRPSYDESNFSIPSPIFIYKNEDVTEAAVEEVTNNLEDDGTTEEYDYATLPDTEVGEDIPVGGKDKFLVPTPISQTADKFEYNGQEYIIVQAQVPHFEAGVQCKHIYGGTLAFVKNSTIANFLAEALSETNLDLDSLWVGGENVSNVWYWKHGSNLEPIDTKLFNTLLTKNPFMEPMQWILAESHRSFICERKEVPSDEPKEESSHKGWIKIGSKLFKIFVRQISWESAVAACPTHNQDATLAVISKNDEAQMLGRYMLIGRPSLENAWIAATYSENFNSYFYINTNLVLPNSTGNEQYPPWKNDKIEKQSGCVLLDRHIANTTKFVEARCDRLRSYICSIEKSEEGDGSTHTDVFIDDLGYRLVHDKKPWNESYEFCEKHYRKYNGKLAVIDKADENYRLLYVMGENRTDIQHLWLGARYDRGVWKWASNDKTVQLSNLFMIVNATYTDVVEKENLCLNMDRENHMVYFHYGTDCSWPQAFVCTFAANDLRRLQEDEKNGKFKQ